MIIGFGNKKGVGKDTSANFLLNNNHFKDYKVVHFADPLKEICSILLNVPREKFEDQDFKSSVLPKEWWSFKVPSIFGGKKIVPYIGNEHLYPESILRKTTVRNLLQLIGTECFRDIITPTTWVNVFNNRYNKNSKIIVADVRFPQEADAIKKLGGKIVRINRLVEFSNHPSETALDNYDYDYIIQNTGTLNDLEIEINKMADKICK